MMVLRLVIGGLAVLVITTALIVYAMALVVVWAYWSIRYGIAGARVLVRSRRACQPLTLDDFLDQLLDLMSK